ncbi:MAG: hypothetical protein IPN46_01610 [Saprospiraceae bacterium]|nr:hypothetical protein [Saprospiraceae bacterium]
MARFALYIFLLLFLGSCISDSDETPQEVACTYDLGNQTLLPTSVTAFPYQNIKTVTFVDSFGVHKIFDVTTEKTSAKLRHSIILIDTTINSIYYKNSEIVNCMFSQSVNYTLKENGGNLILFASVYNDFDTAKPEKTVVDEAEISLTDNGLVASLFPYFNMRIDKRASTDNFTDKIESFGELAIFDKTFKNVFKNVFTTTQRHKVLYNQTEGIVSFTEANGRKWRFESMN